MESSTSDSSPILNAAAESPGTGTPTTTSTATITIRLIRSFEHRNWKPLVLKGLHLNDMTWKDLQEELRRAIECHQGLPSPFRDPTFYDAAKLETDPKTNRTKSSNALINFSTEVVDLSNPEHLSKCLTVSGVAHEMDVSFFKLADYLRYVEQMTKT